MVAKTGVTYQQARRVIETRSPADKTYAQAAAITSVSCGTQTDNIPSLPPLQLLAPVSATPTAVTPTQTLNGQAPERVVAGRAADRRPTATRPQVSRPSSPAVADSRPTAAAGQSAAAAAADAAAATAQAPTESQQTHRPPAGSRYHTAERQTEPAGSVNLGRSGSITRNRLPTSKAGESRNVTKCAGAGSF